MSTLLEKELQRIMDLKKPWSEASKKLTTTWMFVNGEIKYIREFREEGNVITSKEDGNNLDIIKVKTLEIWLPETGIYPLDNGDFVYLTKLPKRQWHKSFSSSFYSVDIFGEKETPEDLIPQLSKAKKMDIFVTPNKDIFWHKTKIGFIENNNTAICTNKNFSQELSDWSKNI